MNLEHPLILRVIEHAYSIGFHFMTHVGDPKHGSIRAANMQRPKNRTFPDQFPMLSVFLERLSGAHSHGAHMGGSLEDLDALQSRLDRFPNYCIDSSATKWMCGPSASSPLSACAILSSAPGSHPFWQRSGGGRKIYVGHTPALLGASDDVGNQLSRRESHRTILMQPAACPKLTGIDLPAEVLEKLYRTNAEKCWDVCNQRNQSNCLLVPPLDGFGRDSA